MSYTYVRATTIGVEQLNNSINMIRRHTLMIELSQSPIPIHKLFREVRKRRDIQIKAEILSEDLEMLRQKGYLIVYQ